MVQNQDKHYKNNNDKSHNLHKMPDESKLSKVNIEFEFDRSWSDAKKLTSQRVNH